MGARTNLSEEQCGCTSWKNGERFRCGLPKGHWRSEAKHCDDYIDDYKAPACLRVFLSVNRLPAITKCAFDEMGIKPALFADYQGQRVRVVMASRLGDVGITPDLDAEHGYSVRVDVEALTNFGATP